MAKIWPLGVVIGSGIVAFVVGLKLSSQMASLLSTAVLVATLVTVAWYTMETRILRTQQRSDSEIRNHPWLKAPNLKVDKDPDQGEGLLGCETLYLPITNIGTTPAYDLRVNVWWEKEGGQTLASEKNLTCFDLAPADTCHLRICEIDFDPGDRAKVRVRIEYASFAGGGGIIGLNFYRDEKGWANAPTSVYAFTLSDGRNFPIP